MMQFRFEDGMTVAELKELLADWPDTHEDGSPCEVWLCDGGGLSNQARGVSPLGLRQSDDGKTRTADLMLEHDA